MFSAIFITEFGPCRHCFPPGILLQPTATRLVLPTPDCSAGDEPDQPPRYPEPLPATPNCALFHVPAVPRPRNKATLSTRTTPAALLLALHPAPRKQGQPRASAPWWMLVSGPKRFQESNGSRAPLRPGGCLFRAPLDTLRLGLPWMPGAKKREILY